MSASHTGRLPQSLDLWVNEALTAVLCLWGLCCLGAEDTVIKMKIFWLKPEGGFLGFKVDIQPESPRFLSL